MLFTTALIACYIGSARIHEATAINYNQSGNLRGRNDRSKDNKFNCSNGCPGIVDPICASGITYQNVCLAHCQGETELAPGSCNGYEQQTGPHAQTFVEKNTSSSMDSFSSDSATIKPQTMHRFAGEGFHYVGSVASTESRLDTNDYDPSTLDNNKGEFDPNMAYHNNNDNAIKSSSITRITSDGDMYVAHGTTFQSHEIPVAVNENGKEDNFEPQEKDKWIDPPATFLENDTNGDYTSEWVFGADTRSRISSSPGWPFWRIVFVEGERSVCSGTIVGRNKVLTNAHCVLPNVPIKVYPGRNGGSPWGHWNVDYATYLTHYKNTGSFDHDYAILTIKNDNWSGRHIGDYMGYFEIDSTSCGVLDGNNFDKRIVGYHGDKSFGSMWNSGKCDNWSYRCGDLTVKYRCDTYKGSSGSGILLKGQDGSHRVIGVNAWEQRQWNGVNGGPAFVPWVASMLKRW